VVIGTISGIGPSKVGQTIDVRVHGGHAYTPSLRIPIALLTIGGAFAVYGAVQGRRLVVGR
jgi:hypothetical protein